MLNDIIDEWLKRLVIWFAVALMFTALGYFWAYRALGYEIYTPQAGWVASDKIKAAMLKMGPRYPYKMVGETLLVNSGAGWQRLRYK